MPEAANRLVRLFFRQRLMVFWTFSNESCYQYLLECIGAAEGSKAVFTELLTAYYLRLFISVHLVRHRPVVFPVR